MFYICLILFSENNLCDAKTSRLHKPSYVFDAHPSGNKTVNVARALNATNAHLEGVTGRTNSGKRLLAAVIDSSINPSLPHMRELKRKGLIHPAAIADHSPYMVNEDEDFDQYKSIIHRLEVERGELSTEEFSWPQPPSERLEKIRLRKRTLEEELNLYRKKNDVLMEKKDWLKKYNSKDANHDGINHGSGVINLFHNIALEASILPIDLLVMGSTIEKPMTSSELLTESIREAVKHNPEARRYGIVSRKGGTHPP